MIIYPSDGDLAYNPFVGDIYKGIKNIERDEKNGSKHGYGYWLDNCGDGKWYCDHCYQRHECGKRIR